MANSTPQNNNEGNESRFFDELSSRLVGTKDNRSVPQAVIAAFLYSIISSQLDYHIKTEQTYPGTLFWVYKSSYRRTIFRDPGLLKHIVDRVDRDDNLQYSNRKALWFGEYFRDALRNRDRQTYPPNEFAGGRDMGGSWNFQIWRVISRLACCMNTHNDMGMITCIREYLKLLLAADTTENQDGVITILIEFYCRLLYIAKIVGVCDDHDQGDHDGDCSGVMQHEPQSRDLLRTSISQDELLQKGYTLLVMLCNTGQSPAVAWKRDRRDKIDPQIAYLEEYFYLEANVIRRFVERVTQQREGKQCQKDC